MRFMSLKWHRFWLACGLVLLVACGPEGNPAPKEEGGTIAATWVRHIGNVVGDRSIDGVAELKKDGKSIGYAVSGTAGDGRSWVGFTDHDGGIVWSKGFGGRPVVPLRTQTAAVATPQGGLLIAGEGTDGRPHLVELDATGAVIATKALADATVFVRALAARPNSYLIAGGLYLNATTIVGWVSELTLELEPVPWTAKIVPSSQGALWFTAVATGPATASNQPGPYGPGRGPSNWIAVGQVGNMGYIASTIGAEDPATDLRTLDVFTVTQLTDVVVSDTDLVVAGYDESGGLVARLDYDLKPLSGWPKTVSTNLPPATASLFERADGLWFGVGEKLVVFSQSGDVAEISRSNVGPIHSVRGWPGHPDDPVVVTSKTLIDVFASSAAEPKTGVYGCQDSPLAVATKGVQVNGNITPRLYTVGLDLAEKPRTGTTRSPCVYAINGDLMAEWGATDVSQTKAAFGLTALPNGDFVAGLSPTKGSVGLVRFGPEGNIVWSRFVKGWDAGEGIGWIPPTAAWDSETAGALVFLARTQPGQHPVLVVVQEDGFLLQARLLPSFFSKVSGPYGGGGAVLTDREGKVARWRSLDTTSLEIQDMPFVADAIATPSGSIVTINWGGTYQWISPDGKSFMQKPHNEDSWTPERHVAELVSGILVGAAVGWEKQPSILSFAFPSENCLGSWTCTNINVSTSAGSATAYATLADDRPTGTIATSDGGILVWGTTKGYAFPNKGAWMLKLTSEATTGGDCSAAQPLPKVLFDELTPIPAPTWTKAALKVLSLEESTLKLADIAVSDEPEQAKSCSGFVVNPPITLSVDIVGDGQVELVSDPPAVSCGVRCWQWPQPGAEVTLTAVPSAGYQFLSWYDPLTETTSQAPTWSEKLVTSKSLSVHLPPVKEEWCNNGLDDDYDGDSDCGDPDCADELSCNGCVSDCNGKTCGDDGCGGSCGNCADGAICVDSRCIACVSDCNGKTCGDDGCGGSCGNCADGAICVDSQCIACVSDCNGKTCGDDGCGGSCGNCADGAICVDSQCIACVSGCNGKTCGDDGCGGSCGNCADGAICVDSQCIACVSDCNGKTCGDDGCGGSCGNCADGTSCVDSQCVNESQCADAPIPVISVSPNTIVTPQTKLLLSGLGSFSPTGSVVSYAWSLTQPGGSVAKMVPSASVAEISLTANVAGTYVFQLHVWDENGMMSCAPAKVEVQVIPDAAIYVVLVWDTPADPDQTNEGPAAGADMDLHVAHSLAEEPDIDKDGLPDPWFDFPYDCFWFNSWPDWGPQGSTGNPNLDRDDTDGAGPELIRIESPEVGVKYRVGVHYWSDKDFGSSTATLRVYIDGDLKFERTGVLMQNLDMWEAITIDWPQGTVTPVVAPGGGDKITPGYVSPLF